MSLRKDPAVRSSLRAALRWLLTALVSVALASGTLLAPPGAAGATTGEARMLARVNAARASHGVPTLRADAYLTAYARRHSRKMAARGTLFHTANFNVLCCWTAIGENAARNSTVGRAHVALMGSPGHRANILNPTFRQVGIGIVRSGGQVWVTQVFRRHS